MVYKSIKLEELFTGAKLCSICTYTIQMQNPKSPQRQAELMIKHGKKVVVKRI